MPPGGAPDGGGAGERCESDISDFITQEITFVHFRVEGHPRHEHTPDNGIHQEKLRLTH
jgi:hypothetical protein